MQRGPHCQLREFPTEGDAAIVIERVLGACACKTQKESGVICDQKIAAGSLDQRACVFFLIQIVLALLLQFPIPKRYAGREREDEIGAFVARLNKYVVVVGDHRSNMRRDAPPRATNGLGSWKEFDRLAHLLREFG